MVRTDKEEQMKLVNFEHTDQLELSIVQDIIAVLIEAINQKGTGTILFSGGNTPKRMLQQLASQKMEWNKVSVGLVDDRMVEATSEHSNSALLKDNFLDLLSEQKPDFHPLVFLPTAPLLNQDLAMESVKLLESPDVVILGMGTDGHFASLFPNDPASTQGLKNDQNIGEIIYTNAPTPPVKRISHTWKFLKNAHHIFLHVTGEKKLEIIQNHQNRQGKERLPIDVFMEDSNINRAIYWAP